MIAAVKVPVTTICSRRMDMATENAGLPRFMVAGFEAGNGHHPKNGHPKIGHHPKTGHQPRISCTMNGVCLPCGAERS